MITFSCTWDHDARSTSVTRLDLTRFLSPQIISAQVPMMPQIIDIQAVCSLSGMSVTMQFDRPYNGVIYSKGAFYSPGRRKPHTSAFQWLYSLALLFRMRLCDGQLKERHFQFRRANARLRHNRRWDLVKKETLIAVILRKNITHTGTDTSGPSPIKYFENTLIMQNDALFQEIWDTGKAS